MKSDIFNRELSKFENEDVKESTMVLLNMLPDYFYTIPASSSGRNHPIFSLGEGGLVRHVKAAMMILEDMFENKAFCDYDSHTRDLIRMALILHDGLKSGITNSGHTCLDHPVLMSKFVIENQDKLLISRDDANFVARLISTHMGPWNKDREGNEIMPVPETNAELLVHLCDYVVSRRWINATFEGDKLCEGLDRQKVL